MDTFARVNGKPFRGSLEGLLLGAPSSTGALLLAGALFGRLAWARSIELVLNFNFGIICN